MQQLVWKEAIRNFPKEVRDTYRQSALRGIARYIQNSRDFDNVFFSPRQNKFFLIKEGGREEVKKYYILSLWSNDCKVYTDAYSKKEEAYLESRQFLVKAFMLARKIIC